MRNEKKFLILKMALKVLINALGLAVVALGLTYLMIYRQFLNEVEPTAEFIEARTKIFYYSAAIIYAFLVFLTAVTRRVNRAVLITFLLIIILTYINMCKFRVRGAPLLPEEFLLAGEAGSLADFIDKGEFIRLVIAIVLSIILSIILGKIIEKAGLELFPKNSLIKRGVIAVAMIFTLGGLTSFIFQRTGERYEKIKFLDTTLTAWNQTVNYNDNGFLIGFLYNLAKLETEAPEGYSKEKVSEIKKEYEEKLSEEVLDLDDIGGSGSVDGLSDAKKKKPNVVIILNESFMDPETVRDYYQYNFSGGDVTPNLHEIEKKAMSGKMFSPDYGGGTANIEFEALTGLTNYWLNTVPYTSLLSRRGKITSVASELKELGYRTVAIHPYNGEMYKRNIVLKNEGFEKFITEKEMNFRELEYDSGYINDRSIYQEILKELREDGEGETKLVLAITMQNHVPYEDLAYGGARRFILPEEYSGTRRGEIETYLETLYYSDKHLGELINEMDNLGEETVVLFFGDHNPGIFDELALSEENEEVKKTRLTPYFIYKNYEDEGTEYQRGGELETVTPNCMIVKTKELAGIPLTALNLLTSEVCRETPVLAPLYNDYEEIRTELLKKYEIITYSLVAG